MENKNNYVRCPHCKKVVPEEEIIEIKEYNSLKEKFLSGTIFEGLASKKTIRCINCKDEE